MSMFYVVIGRKDIYRNDTVHLQNIEMQNNEDNELDEYPDGPGMEYIEYPFPAKNMEEARKYAKEFARRLNGHVISLDFVMV